MHGPGVCTALPRGNWLVHPKSDRGRDPTNSKKSPCIGNRHIGTRPDLNRCQIECDGISGCQFFSWKVRGGWCCFYGASECELRNTSNGVRYQTYRKGMNSSFVENFVRTINCYLEFDRTYNLHLVLFLCLFCYTFSRNHFIAFYVKLFSYLWLKKLKEIFQALSEKKI